MVEARSFASLSSGLLARKGAAKPAMRPQAFGHIGASLDDLGWNDMGEAEAAAQAAAHASHAAHSEEAAPEHVPSSIAALTPSPRPVAEPAPVREQQRAIADSLGAEAEEVPAAPEAAAAPAPVVAMPRRRVPMAARDKAAFTLRLDPDRHFRLRLACAVSGRSAQQIVTGALDEILKTYPEIDALAGQLPAARARS
ncbi:MAG TPA: hypothetical protein VEZ20_02050 [Allosphingosinicella sp.]|jgi:hypothetical protein|nr:hypothetical protein [Allosphingosinicella sp.]